MADAFITRKGGAALEIAGQQIVSGEYDQTITKFETVFANFVIPSGLANWDTPSSLLQLGNVQPPYEGDGAPEPQDLAFSPDGIYLAKVHAFSPNLTIYKKTNDIFTKLADPAVLPPSTGMGVAFSPDGIYLAVVTDSPNGVLIYKREGDVFTKLADASTFPQGHFPEGSQPGEPFGVAFAASKESINYLAVTGNPQRPLTLYRQNGDVFTRLPNPVGFPDQHSNYAKPSFSADATYLAFGGFDSSHQLSVYKRSDDTFTLLTNLPEPEDTFYVSAVAFSPDGIYLAVGTVTMAFNPVLVIYKRNGDTFTILANSVTPSFSDIHEGFSVNDITDLAFSADGKFLALTHNAYNDTVLTMYKRTGDAFQQIIDVVPLSFSFPAISRAVDFSKDGAYLAVGESSDPYVRLYKTTVEEPGEGTTKIVRAINKLPGANTTDAGYALEDGIAGEIKTMISLFKEEV